MLKSLRYTSYWTPSAYAPADFRDVCSQVYSNTVIAEVLLQVTLNVRQLYYKAILWILRLLISCNTID